MTDLIKLINYIYTKRKKEKPLPQLGKVRDDAQTFDWLRRHVLHLLLQLMFAEETCLKQFVVGELPMLTYIINTCLPTHNMKASRTHLCTAGVRRLVSLSWAVHLVSRSHKSPLVSIGQTNLHWVRNGVTWWTAKAKGSIVRIYFKSCLNFLFMSMLSSVFEPLRIIRNEI